MPIIARDKWEQETGQGRKRCKSAILLCWKEVSASMSTSLNGEDTIAVPLEFLPQKTYSSKFNNEQQESKVNDYSKTAGKMFHVSVVGPYTIFYDSTYPMGSHVSST